MAKKAEDLTGQVFSRMTVIRMAERTRTNSGKIKPPYWHCVCECGVKKVVQGGHLKNGSVRSCGCLMKEEHSARMSTHGRSSSPHYDTYRHMMDRCNKPDHKSYPSYGGRGITVCTEWTDSVVSFLDWCDKTKLVSTHTLERVDNDKGYSPNNCVWADRQVQAVNQRTKSNNTSGIRGVHFNKCNRKWSASVVNNNVRKHLGSFDRKEEAMD